MVFQAQVKSREIIQPSNAPALQAATSILAQQAADERLKKQLGLDLLKSGLSFGNQFLARRSDIKEQLRQEALAQELLGKDIEALRGSGIEVPNFGTDASLKTFASNFTPTTLLANLEKAGGLVAPSQLPSITSRASQIAQNALGVNRGSAENINPDALQQESLPPRAPIDIPKLTAERLPGVPSDIPLQGGIETSVQTEPEIGLVFQKNISEQKKRDRQERIGNATEQASIKKALADAQFAEARAFTKANELNNSTKANLFIEGKPDSDKVFDVTGMVPYNDLKMTDSIRSQRALFERQNSGKKSERIKSIQEGAGTLIELSSLVEEADNIIKNNPNAFIRIGLGNKLFVTGVDPEVGSKLQALNSQLGSIALRLAVLDQGSKPTDEDVKVIRDAMPDLFQNPKRFEKQKELFFRRLLGNAMRESIVTGAADQYNAMNVYHKRFVRDKNSDFELFGTDAAGSMKKPLTRADRIKALMQTRTEQ